MKRSALSVLGLFILLANFLVAGALNANILIIAPHPDDDLLYASGIAHNAVAMEKSVKVVFITNGDYGGLPTGYLRQGEAVTAQSWLGVDEDSLIFLGYPDGHLTEIYYFYPNETDNFTAPSGQSTTYGNRGLGRTDFHTYRWGIPANYNRHNIVMDLQDILLTYRPTQIITTSEFDVHGDHRTAYALLTLALANANVLDPHYNPAIYKTIVHWPHGSWPNLFDPHEYFAEIPNLYDQTGLLWDERASLRLPHYAVAPKVNAIAAHRSQGGFSGLLGRYIHKDEFFWVERLFGNDLPPIANAGADQVVGERDPVVLDGSGSSGGNGNSLSFQWLQTAGVPVGLLDPATASPSFVAPQGLTGHEHLVFRLVVDDGDSSALPDFTQVRVIASNPYPNVASLASVTASSENAGDGQLAIKAVDGVVDGFPGDYTREWATLGGRAGAWLQLDWPEPYTIDRVILYDRPNANDHILQARLIFSDGFTVEGGALNNAGGGDTVTFSPRQTTSLRMVIDTVASTTQNIGLAEIEVFGTASQTELYTLSTAVDPPGTGTIARTPNQPSYSPGTEVILQATPASGYEFSHWSGALGGTQNPTTLSMDGPKSVTAHFVTIVETVSVPTSPQGPASGTVGVSYTYSSGGAASSLGNPVEYQFDWGDGRLSGWSSATTAATAWATAGSYAVRVRARAATDTTVLSDWSAPLSVTVEVALIAHTVNTSPAGLQIVVDGTPYSAPQTFNWAPGSSHTLAVVSPQDGAAGTRQVFASWSNGGAQTHTVTAGPSPTSYTASFTTQYRLSTATDPAGGGTVSPAGESWHSAGQAVALSATPASGYEFSHWSGALGGTQNPTTLSMDGPKSVTAHFVTIGGTLTVSPEASFDTQGRAGGPFSPNRQTYTLRNSGGTTITWRLTSTANWLSVSSAGGSLAPGATATVNLMIVNRETRNLAVGTYTDTVVFENLTNGAGDTTRQVNMSVIRGR